jgi:hypothetical protein
MLLTPNVSNLLIAEVLRAAWNGGTPLVARLFQNNYTPIEATVVGNFVEATYNGYVAQSLVSWASAVLITNQAHIIPAALIWQHTAGSTSNTIYGWYATDSGGTQLWMCERFGTPQVLAVNGDAFALQPDFYVTHS